MAKRKKLKKMSLKEVKAPDEFQTSVAKVVDFMRDYGKWVYSAIAAVLVVIVAGIVVSRHMDTLALDRALEFEKAFATVAEQTSLEPAAPGGDDEDAASGTQEASQKLKAAAASLGEFSSANQGTPIAGIALYASGSAALGAGDFETAYASYKAFLDSNPDDTLRYLAWESIGIAADNLGKPGEAEEAYREMAKSSSSLVSANAYLHLGDLYNPATGGKEGPKAKGFYESGVKEVAGEADMLPPATLLVRRTLEQRIAALP